MLGNTAYIRYFKSDVALDADLEDEQIPDHLNDLKTDLEKLEMEVANTNTTMQSNLVVDFSDIINKEDIVGLG